MIKKDYSIPELRQLIEESRSFKYILNGYTRGPIQLIRKIISIRVRHPTLSYLVSYLEEEYKEWKEENKEDSKGIFAEVPIIKNNTESPLDVIYRGRRYDVETGEVKLENKGFVNPSIFTKREIYKSF